MIIMVPTHAETQIFDPYMAPEFDVEEVEIVADMDQQMPSPSSVNSPVSVSDAALEDWTADANLSFEEFIDMSDDSESHAEADMVADIDYENEGDEPVHLALSPQITLLDDDDMDLEVEEELAHAEMALSTSVIFLDQDMEQVDDEPVELALTPSASTDDEIMHCQVSYPMPDYAYQPQVFDQGSLLQDTANQNQSLVETMDYDFSGMDANGCWPQHQTTPGNVLFESQNIQPGAEELYSPVSDNGNVAQYGHNQPASQPQFPSVPGTLMEQQQQQQVQSASPDQLPCAMEYAQYNPNAATRPPMLIQNFFQATTINVSFGQ
jgi:hypothetical protein